MARVPKNIGPYELGDVLGKGGMGEVFRAKHTLLDRSSALKRLVVDTDDPAQVEVWRERFLREGRAVAKLQHEHIVAVYDLIEYRSDLWLVMELVDGFGLDELTKAGALPIDVACMVALGVARALEVAHRAGIVHRDVKPGNVIVSRSGTVKLMDFGIAKDENLDSLTKTGGVVGTPSYMAPELVKGQPASPRSDIYAVGALLYELLSGRRLFAHATPESIWNMVSSGKFPRLGKVAPNIPWRLTLLVERCLKVDPKRRPPSCAELRQQLELFLTDWGAPADENGRLVSWLCATGKVGEAFALTVVADTSLLVEVVPLRRRAQPWRAAALVFVLVSSLLFAALATQTDLLERATAFFEGRPMASEAPVDDGAEKPHQRVNGPRR